MTPAIKKQRILFIIPSLNRGGAEVQVVNLVNRLDPNRFEVHLLCFDENVLMKRILNQEVVFHHIRRNSFFDKQLINKIASLIDTLEIDAVHCSLQIALFFGWMAVNKSALKPPIILALHTTVNRNLKADIYDWVIYQWMMRGCKKVICVCKNQQRHWQKKFPFLKQLTRVIYNGIDTDYFAPAVVQNEANLLRDRLNIPDNMQVVCHIAGFRPEKGHAILLEAFEQVFHVKKNIMLVFVGDGELKEVIEKQVIDKGLSGNVIFLGLVSDVRPILALSDLSVIASTAVETFSIAMLESMSMEVPLIATDVGGAGEAVIDGTTGYLVPINDVQVMKNTLVNALSEPQQLKMLGCKARELVVENFSVDNMVHEVSELLIDAIQDI